MTPAARLQAAIEIVDQVIVATRDGGAAADTLIKRYFKTRRYAGSGDRRAVRELVYAAIRRSGKRPPGGRAALIGLASEMPGLAAQFDGSPHGPPPIGDDAIVAEDGGLPKWLRRSFAAELTDEDVASLSGRAPLDIRVNLSRISRDEALAQLDGAETGQYSDRALRLPQGYPLEQHALWTNGAIDIQDEGSQLVADACEAKPGQLIVDLCAGAGGKTLALWDRTAGKARLIACDTDRGRLSRLPGRARRAHMEGIVTRLLDPGRESEAFGDLAGRADGVLVDAPCSGAGTWRRNPEARWRLTPDRLAGHRSEQARLLDIAAELVAPGGNLVYAVCSLLADEGSTQISAFLSRHSAFRKEEPAIDAAIASGAGYLLTPARHGTDGFFFARLLRSC